MHTYPPDTQNRYDCLSRERRRGLRGSLATKPKIWFGPQKFAALLTTARPKRNIKTPKRYVQYIICESLEN